ncbi:uncharacterized protein LOC143425724 [Xylocopa sonorina]|uniref:uncharacterized protein LOC143425724 n=1 Tax=Xylocopa sonorina TaxID=1818115 RepID=UPI00403A9BC8
MSKEYCFLCASDEGVFLDITVDNKQIFHEQFEICSFTKVPTIEQLPNKICYKCAYELNQCSTFVQKYKQAVKQRSSTRKQGQKICCCLCHEAGKTKYIFDLSKDKGLQHNAFDKIQKLFNYDLRESPEEHKFICLSCRYTVDLLLDLKNVCTETATKLNTIIGKDIDYLTFPKIKTTVVSRKTTITECGRTNLHVLQESNNNFTDMTRTRSQQNKISNKKLDGKSKLRVCNKCNNSVKTGDDMYKIHNTGKIVCKSCWKSTDIHKNGTEKHVQQNLSETKHCTVFLKDVLKDTEIKDKNLYRIDEDNEGKKTYVVTEKESDKAVDDVSNKRRRQVQSRSVKSTRTENESTDNEDLPHKKSKSEEKEINKIIPEESKSATPQLRQRKRKNSSSNIGQSSDSEPPATRASKRGQGALTRHKRATGSSLSDADLDNKHNRKKLRTILRGIPIMANMNVNDKSSSNKDEPRRKRTRQTSVPPKQSEASDDDSKKSIENDLAVQEVNSEDESVAKPSTTSQETQSSKPDDKGDIFETQTYVCDECGTSYENRLLGLTHKLSHYKQPKLELKELSNEISTKDVTPDTTETADDQSDDPNEAIAITVDDDEEELVEDENNLNNEAELDSTTDNKCHSSKKEMLEDAVDVELVMKESDDDQVRKVQKETEDEQVDEETDIDIVNASIEEFEVKQAESKSSCKNEDKIHESVHECIKDKNVDSEEKQDVPCSKTEDTQKQQNEISKLEKDIQDNGESQMEEVKMIEEKRSKKVEDEKEEVVENEGKDNDIEQTKEEEKVVENERKDDDIQQIKEKENLVEDEGESDDIEQNGGKEDAEENVESSEVQEDEKVESKEEIVDKDEDGPSDKCQQNNSTNKEVEDEVDNLFDKTNDLKETVDQKSDNESIIQIKADSGSNVSEKIVLSEEGSTIDRNGEVVETSISDASKGGKSANDSANAAAEVLQEVLDLANAEVQKRQESSGTNNEDDAIEAETLENISREIHNIDTLSSKENDGKSNHINVK